MGYTLKQSTMVREQWGIHHTKIINNGRGIMGHTTETINNCQRTMGIHHTETINNGQRTMYSTTATTKHSSETMEARNNSHGAIRYSTEEVINSQCSVLDLAFFVARETVVTII